MVLGELIGDRFMRHRRYCKDQATWPIMASNGGTVQDEDSHFNDLKQMVKNILQKTRTTAPWISDATWRLSDQRTALGRNLAANQ